MTTANTDAYNLATMAEDGAIHEDVMNQIWDVSKVPLIFSDTVGTSGHDNQYFSWRVDQLPEALTNDQAVDGQDVDQNDSELGKRMGNWSEIKLREVQVSTRANEVNTIGYASELAYQVTRRQQDLRRSVEATAMSNNASVEGTDTVAGVTAGLAAWLVGDVDVTGAAVTGLKNVSRAADGVDGGWYATPTDKLVAASQAGTAEALTETKVRDVMQAIWEKGNVGDKCGIMSGAVKRAFSEYLFTSSARIASLVADGGGEASQRKGSGSVDVFLTDFGTLTLKASHLIPEVAPGNEIMYILDPSYASLSYLQGYRVEPLSKTGLSDKRMMSVDWATRITNTDAHGAVADIDPTLAVTYS